MNILDNFKRSAMIAHILYHASKKSVYGAWLIQELTKHGYTIGPGTLYPWLNDLKKQHLLSQKIAIVKGKRRKYYSITKQGLKTLQEFKNFLKELYDEIFEEEPIKYSKQQKMQEDENIE